MIFAILILGIVTCITCAAAARRCPRLLRIHYYNESFAKYTYETIESLLIELMG